VSDGQWVNAGRHDPDVYALGYPPLDSFDHRRDGFTDVVDTSPVVVVG